MFVVEKVETVRWPVTIHVPADGGTTTAHRVEVTYRVLDEDELEALSARHGGDDIKLLPELIVELHGFQRADGTPWSHDSELMSLCVRRPYIRRALVDGFHAARFGVVRKN